MSGLSACSLQLGGGLELLAPMGGVLVACQWALLVPRPPPGGPESTVSPSN